MTGADTLILLVQIWGGVGLLVSVCFLTFGVGQIDEDARGALVFRPLLVPGILLIWPLVLWRWWMLATDRDNWHARHRPPRRRHGIVWAIVAALIVLTFGSAMALRQTWPADVAPVQTAPPAEVSE